jgi:hypothetical protein
VRGERERRGGGEGRGEGRGGEGRGGEERRGEERRFASCAAGIKFSQREVGCSYIIYIHIVFLILPF